MQSYGQKTYKSLVFSQFFVLKNDKSVLFRVTLDFLNGMRVCTSYTYWDK